MRALIGGIDMYPLAEYDGTMKQRDWSRLPKLASPTGDGDAAETRWVFPEKFVDELPAVMRDAPPLPGESARYAEILSVIAAAQKDPALKKAMTDEAVKADADLVGPLLQFRNFGIPLPGYWTTVDNGAAFGTDYFTRTAVAKSNILVNKAAETKYFYQDLDSSGARLNGGNRYTVTFAKGQLPPVTGFWSLTMYNAAALLRENPINRYSIGTKNKDLGRRPMARSPFTCRRRSRRMRRRRRIGCPLPRMATSRSMSARTARRPPSSRENGRHRRWSRRSRRRG